MPAKSLSVRRATNRRAYHKHRAARRAQQAVYRKAYHARWRSAVLAALGEVCVRCGYADPRPLQIDHVFGGGNQERKRNNQQSAKYYQDVIREADSGKYQLLCANCNWIKYVEGK